MSQVISKSWVFTLFWSQWEKIVNGVVGKDTGIGGLGYLPEHLSLDDKEMLAYAKHTLHPVKGIVPWENIGKPIVWGASCVEIGEGGRVHIQGYLRLKESCTMKQLKEWFGMNGAHFEKAKGSALQNYEYIYHVGRHEDKSGALLKVFEDVGSINDCKEKKKEKSDDAYRQVILRLKSGEDLFSIMMDYPGICIRCYNQLSKIESMFKSRRTLKRNVKKIEKGGMKHV